MEEAETGQVFLILSRGNGSCN